VDCHILRRFLRVSQGGVSGTGSSTPTRNAVYFLQVWVMTQPACSPQGNQKPLGPATTPYETVTPSLSSRPERSGAEGPAVPRTFPGNVFRTEQRNLQLPKEPPELHHDKTSDANQREGNSVSGTRDNPSRLVKTLALPISRKPSWVPVVFQALYQGTASAGP
jgi:hypothetical protein